MELTPGLAIGPYRLTEPAGAGGMAEVWRAHDVRLNRYVAIKFLSPRFATDPGYLDRFRREAQAISRFDHPNILTVYDYGEQDGWTYMVSPYIGGGTLAARMRRGSWPVDEAITILEPLASALDYAHAEGIVHRDVKPSNVLFTDRDRLVLSDFGIARIVESSTHLSQTGLLIGTPMYMSPEQADGQRTGPPSDLYSLGVVAYEMLTGKPPFSGETPIALALAHLHKPLPPPRMVNPALPEMIEGVLFTILAKDPSHRYQSGADFVEALKAANVRPSGPAIAPRSPATASASVSNDAAPPDSPSLVSARPSTPDPAPPHGTSAPTVGATAATVGATAATVGAPPPVAPFAAPRPIAPPPAPIPTASPRGGISRRAVIIGGLAATAAVAGGLSLFRVSPFADNPAPAQPTTVAPAQPTTVAPAQPTTVAPAQPTTVAPSPTAAPKFTLVRTFSPEISPGTRVGVASIALSPDGQTVAATLDPVQGDRTDMLVYGWRVSDGGSVFNFQARRRIVNDQGFTAFSPDGAILATTDQLPGVTRLGVRLSRASNGSLLRMIGPSPGPANDVAEMSYPAFSRDSTMLATTTDRQVDLWRTATGEHVRTLQGHSGLVFGIVFSPDGQTVLTGSGDKTARLWRVADGSAVRVFEGHPGLVTVAFSDDGQTVATVSTGQDGFGIRLWRTSDGSPVRTIFQDNRISNIAFLPGGRTLVVAVGDKLRLLNVADGATLAEQDVDVAMSLAVSGDGRLLATHRDKDVSVWRLE